MRLLKRSLFALALIVAMTSGQDDTVTPDEVEPDSQDPNQNDVVDEEPATEETE